MGGALSSYHISAGSIYQYSTTLCALRPIWSRFNLKLFFGIILGSWSSLRFTKPHLTSTSGRATLTQTSTCLTLLSSFQSGRYLGHCYHMSGILDIVCTLQRLHDWHAQTLFRCRAWVLRKLIHLRELRGEKKLFPSCGWPCVAPIYKYKYKHKHNYKWFHSKIPELFAGTEKTWPRPAGVDSSRPSLVKEHFLSLIIW